MSYWSDRQKELCSSLEKDENELKQRLASIYEDEYAKLDREIAAYYQKYGENNVIKYRNLMQTLPADDVKLLIEQTDDFAAKYPQYANVLPVRTSIYKLNRLEGLQYSVRMHQLEIGAVNQQEITKHLNKLALKGANTSVESMGFGKNFYTESADIIKLFVDVPWCSGKSFSQRIWEDCDKLANYITTDIAQGFARGASYQKLTKQLHDRFVNVSKRDAYRLIYTEGTYVMAESTMQPFTEDFEQYRISTAADGKVCSICSSVAKEKFYIKDRKPGINFPPFHPWCRCTFEIVVDNWDKWLDDYVKRHGGNGRQAEKMLNNFSNDDIISPNGFDLPKQWDYKGETNIIEDLKSTNPKFNDNIIYQINCQKCVPTYEMRRRGYDVEALPTMSNADIIKNRWYKVFEDAEIIKAEKNTKITIINALKSYGDGSRVQIYVESKNHSSSHTFVGENFQGKIYFIDPQNCSNAEYLFDSNLIDFTKTLFFRIDNLQPTELIKQCSKGVNR